MSLTNQIVTVNVSVTKAPTPSVLQETGTFVSQGGTTKAAGTLTLLTVVGDMAAILAGAKTVTNLVYSSGSNTVTGTSAAHGFPIGDTIYVTVAGATPAGYNGTFLATIVDADTFTYAMPTSLAVATVFGTVTDEDVAELAAMNTTFFAQGATQAVYVLELGNGTIAEGVTALASFITTNPKLVYSFLVPRTWDSESTFKTMVGNYDAPETPVNFFVTTTTSTYSTWGGVHNSVYAAVESPNKAITQFELAADLHRSLSRRPNSGTPIMTMALLRAYGVEVYPTFGNSTLLQQLRTANIGWFDTGSEGGIASGIFRKWGRVLSGESFDFWYAVDWAKLTLELDMSNEILNGNNNSIAPLYYNQKGVDRLQDRGAEVLRRGTVYGLLYGTVEAVQLPPQTFADNVTNHVYAGKCVINAIPLVDYARDNPSDYSQHLYSGFQVAIIPQGGFEQIIVNLNATEFLY
jgi:hypothetical protein